MEDLKSRLKFEDVNIRSRCLQKLLSSVKKKSKGNSINSSSVQIPELNLILEACEDESPITSSLAVQAITSLVTNNCMNIDYAYNKLLSCMKSSKNYQPLISGITSLLIHSFQVATDKVSNYSLLFPKHPLIAALDDREDCFPFIVESVLELVSSDFSKAVQVMEPVICCILCNPLQKQEFNYLKVLFLESFILCQNNYHDSIVHVFKYMPFMQTASIYQVAEICHFLIKLNDAVGKLDSANPHCVFIMEHLLLIAFSTMERSIALGQNPSQLIELLIKLYQLFPKEKKLSISVNVCLVLLSFMIKSVSSVVLDKIVLLGLDTLEIDGVSPTIAALLALSVIHILPEPSLVSYNEAVKVSLSKLLRKLELIYTKNEPALTEQNESSDSKVLKSGCSNTDDTSKTFHFFEAFTPATDLAFALVKFSCSLDKWDTGMKLNWLETIRKYSNVCCKENFDVIYSIVAALFLMSPEEEIFLHSCLETLESILQTTPHLSTKIFSLLLYKMNSVDSPKIKLLILNFLPKSAVHKYAISPVLGVLQMMARETELKAHAIYLMLHLWKKQDRCFSHLYSLLTETNKPFTFDSGVNEILIAQAAAILEICHTVPDKYGHEFLVTLSNIFNKCLDEASLPVACLAMDGIIALCRSEVIDIRSTWKALSGRLIRDKRTLISCRMFQFLGLVPEMRVKSYEYDKFMTETVANIWKIISASSYCEAVLSEAFKTLANFPMDCHELKQLPTAAKVNLKLPASMKATPFEMSKLPEDVLTYIPGYCFIDLLMSYENETILEGYVSFLRSLIKMEVEELPRSAYSQTRHVARRKKVSEAFNKVPEFLCNQFQARKSPAVQKNLAVGVLFAYEPPIEYGKDGFPIKRSIASQSRSYEQVLTVLLNEVNIDTTEWHRCILISNAWCAFMERAFFACEEARRAELELQSAHGHINLTPDELSKECKYAWLWIRDRIVGIIKTNVKNTSTAHANGVFAISGLIFALDKFYNSLDENSKSLSDENDKHMIHRHFMAEYVETIICAMHHEYQPTGKVQSWLLTHCSRPNSSAGFLVTGCASSSLCHLALMLTSYYSNDIPQLFDIMLKNLGHSSPVLSFYSGKGIGLLIKSLCESGFLDVGQPQINLLLGTVKQMKQMYEDSDGSLTSCLIGLAISMANLSQGSDENIKDWISTTCNIFYEKLMDEEKSSMQFEMLCICVTAMIISATEGSCLPIQNIEDLASWIEMNRLELPQCSGISVSLGMLIEAFERFGHSEGSEMKQKVLKGWFNTVTAERKPTLQKIAALNGLCSLLSCGRGLTQPKQSLPESISCLNDLIPIMFKVLGETRDNGLQGICSWEIGRLFSVHSNQQEVESSVSASYSYLGEKSILKPLMNVILSHQKEDETPYKNCHVLACLKSLAAPFPRPLPPINWITILTPFLQQNEDIDAVEAALLVAVHQSSGSSYATNLVASYSNPPLIHTLPESCFKILLENMPGITLILPPPKLQLYLQTFITQTIKKDDALKSTGDVTMLGILNSLKQTGYKKESIKILQNAFISILKFFKPSDNYMKNYLPWISEVLLLLPEDMLNSQLSVSRNIDEVAVLTLIWCHLIKTGKKPLSSLRPCIEEGKNCPIEQKEKICSYVYDCFINGIHCEVSELSQGNKCISWLLETIGWIKVLEDTKSKYQLLTTSEVYTYLVDVCLATIIGCSGLESSYSFMPLRSLNHYCLLQAFPQALSSLSHNMEWNAIVDKIIDWLLMLLKSQYIKENEKYYIKLALCSLKGTNQFLKKEVWTEVISNALKN